MISMLPFQTCLAPIIESLHCTYFLYCKIVFCVIIFSKQSTHDIEFLHLLTYDHTVIETELSKLRYLFTLSRFHLKLTG